MSYPEMNELITHVAELIEEPRSSDFDGLIAESQKELDEYKVVLAKAELFDECLEHLEELKYTANPNDVIGVYENVISVFREYLSKEDSQ